MQHVRRMSIACAQMPTFFSTYTAASLKCAPVRSMLSRQPSARYEPALHDHNVSRLTSLKGVRCRNGSSDVAISAAVDCDKQTIYIGRYQAIDKFPRIQLVKAGDGVFCYERCLSFREYSYTSTRFRAGQASYAAVLPHTFDLRIISDLGVLLVWRRPRIDLEQTAIAQQIIRDGWSVFHAGRSIFGRHDNVVCRNRPNSTDFSSGHRKRVQ